MTDYAALDVSQAKTAICVVDGGGAVVKEGVTATCPDAIRDWLIENGGDLTRLGMETGPLAVWLWNALIARDLPIVCIDARHANAALKMMPNKTDRHDAIGLAQIMRTGWFKEVRIKSHGAYVMRAHLVARDALVGTRVRLENEIRGLLKTFGVMFGKRVGGFMQRAEEILRGELALSPELLGVLEALIEARRAILERIKELDRLIRAIARRSKPVQLLMTAPGVGPITALSVVSAFDDAGRFRKSSSAGAYLGLAPRRFESGETSRQGRISRRGDKMTRTHLYEAANAILTRKIGGDALRDWGLKIAAASGYKKAKVAVARKLAVILHAMWKTQTPFAAA